MEKIAVIPTVLLPPRHPERRRRKGRGSAGHGISTAERASERRHAAPPSLPLIQFNLADARMVVVATNATPPPPPPRLRSVRASVHFSKGRARERGRERVPAPKQSGAQVFLPVAPARCRVRHEMILIMDDHFRQLRFRVGRPFMRQESIANEFQIHCLALQYLPCTCTARAAAALLRRTWLPAAAAAASANSLRSRCRRADVARSLACGAAEK